MLNMQNNSIFMHQNMSGNLHKFYKSGLLEIVVKKKYYTV